MGIDPLTGEWDNSDPVLQQQQQAVQLLEQTPQERQQNLESAGVPDYNGFKEDGIEFNQPQQQYQQPLTYSGLIRNDQGQLEGVGVGQPFDQNQIILRAGDAGQLSPASDQGQQYQQLAAQRDRQQAVNPQANTLETLLSKVQLNSTDRSRMRLLQDRIGMVSRQMQNGQISPLAGTHVLKGMQAELQHYSTRDTEEKQLTMKLADQKFREEHAKNAVTQLENLKIGAKTAQDRVHSVITKNGEEHFFYTDPSGKTWPLDGKSGAGKGDQVKGEFFDAPTHLKNARAEVEGGLHGAPIQPKKDDGKPNPEFEKKVAEVLLQKQGEHNTWLQQKKSPEQPATGAEQPKPPTGQPAAEQAAPPEPPFTLEKPVTPRQQQFSNSYGALSIRVRQLPQEKQDEAEKNLQTMGVLAQKYGGSHQITNAKDQALFDAAAKRLNELLPQYLPDRPSISTPASGNRPNNPSWYPGNVGAPVGR